MDHSTILKTHLSDLGLPADAIGFVEKLWRVSQFFDDLVDGEAIEGDDFDDALRACLIGLPCDPFYSAHAANLAPVIMMAIEKWRASDFAELSGRADARSFVWRAGFYDVVLMCATLSGLTRQPWHSEQFLALYGETFPEYQREFSHA